MVNNYYQQKSGGGLGLTNALLLGVGGLSLYNAFKPGETKIIYVNNSTNPEDARTVSNNGTHVLVSDNSTTVATPLAPFPDHCAQYMNQPVPPQQLETTSATPLAPMPGAEPAVPLAPMPDAAAAVPLAPLPDAAAAPPGSNAPAETTTMVAETTTMATEGETTMQPPVAPTGNSTTGAPAATTAAPASTPQVPLIPSECLPFVTGAVLPSNYTAPPMAAGFGQAPNPNINYGNPSWNTVPLEGVQQKGTSGVEGLVGQSAMVLMSVVVLMRGFL